MTLSSPRLGMPTPQLLSVMTPEITGACGVTASSPASAVWPANNEGLFFPVYVDQPRTYVKAWWMNGQVAAGNVDLGVYTLAGTTMTRIASTGAIAQAGVSAMQVANIGPVTLAAGLYYLALSCSLATATMQRATPNLTLIKAIGAYQNLAAHPLGTPLTVVTIGTGGIVPVFGLSELTSL